ncbi:DNA-directed RNA polymerase III subunit RPC10-like [Impatiens glandulifera]|uniref:DNA-directed RNA polymerase III subunit RPC10-like n=1 Tax=Impatiens glandulifera TaxID=253017 RepID=UPI001FB07030|nr:DNA-directed RNA polymerase III subunit RPC10-like [Impatiens glandulifera]
MEFCPECGMMLQFQLPNLGRPSRFKCPACPYVYYLDKNVKIKKNIHLPKASVDPIFTQEDIMNGQKIDGHCLNCGHGKLVFQELQIKSVDEPITKIYWCLNDKCKHTWRED